MSRWKRSDLLSRFDPDARVWEKPRSWFRRAWYDKLRYPFGFPKKAKILRVGTCDYLADDRRWLIEHWMFGPTSSPTIALAEDGYTLRGVCGWSPQELRDLSRG